MLSTVPEGHSLAGKARLLAKMDWYESTRAPASLVWELLEN